MQNSTPPLPYQPIRNRVADNFGPVKKIVLIDLYAFLKRSHFSGRYSLLLGIPRIITHRIVQRYRAVTRVLLLFADTSRRLYHRRYSGWEI